MVCSRPMLRTSVYRSVHPPACLYPPTCPSLRLSIYHPTCPSAPAHPCISPSVLLATHPPFRGTQSALGKGYRTFSCPTAATALTSAEPRAAVPTGAERGGPSAHQRGLAARTALGLLHSPEKGAARPALRHHLVLSGHNPSSVEEPLCVSARVPGCWVTEKPRPRLARVLSRLWPGVCSSRGFQCEEGV